MKAILVLTSLGIISLLAEIFRFRRALYPIVILGLMGAIATTVSYWWYDDGDFAKYFGGMINFEDSSVIFSTIIITTGLLWFLMSDTFFNKDNPRTDLVALVLFAMVGAVILTCYTNMAMLFLGVEILSIPLYVLAGSRKDSLSSNEAAFKYFIMGAFASAFLLFGIALVYGATGSFNLGVIGQVVEAKKEALPGFFMVGVLMLVVSLLFKVSAAPFHFWAPDVYQGAPTHVTAFMSTIVKTAAIVAILRLFLSVVFDDITSFWMPIILVCVGITFVVSNVSAAVQNNVKRMLAYSSISHAGFLLLAVGAFNAYSAKAIVFYTAAYSVGSILAFAVLTNVIKDHTGGPVESFNGLGKKSPFMALVMTIALLSLAGIPPTAGFFGKYYVFNAALQAGHVWLVILGIIGSLIGVYYYFRVIIAMYFKDANEEATVEPSKQHQLVMFVTAVIIIVLGLLPDLILGIGSAAEVVAAK
jgi:NADH-quinone oxidoreductase subunit N